MCSAGTAADPAHSSSARPGWASTSPVCASVRPIHSPNGPARREARIARTPITAATTTTPAAIASTLVRSSLVVRDPTASSSATNAIACTMKPAAALSPTAPAARARLSPQRRSIRRLSAATPTPAGSTWLTNEPATWVANTRPTGSRALVAPSWHAEPATQVSSTAASAPSSQNRSARTMASVPASTVGQRQASSPTSTSGEPQVSVDRSQPDHFGAGGSGDRKPTGTRTPVSVISYSPIASFLATTVTTTALSEFDGVDHDCPGPIPPAGGRELAGG